MKSSELNVIFDLMRIESLNFTQIISKQLKAQLVRDFELTEKEITIIENIFRESFAKIYFNFSSEPG